VTIPGQYIFAHPETSDRQGLLAIGGDLLPERILAAYQQGVFPWFEPGGPILWWCPDPRLILEPHEFKISRSLNKSLKKPYTLSKDTAFAEVIKACATHSNRTDHTWITSEMIEAYTTLHQMGYAHSFEVWENELLIGGLYGISLGTAFFGESMFHTVTDASKIALSYLCDTMINWNYDFIDCQLPTTHLQRLGAKIVGRKDFLHLLNNSLKNPTQQGIWTNKEYL
jgi:leucyl/phenylalanyl-tRNA--protein transferase